MLQVTETEYCRLEVHYIAETELVAAKRRQAIAILKKQPIPGYRPGKAPDFAIAHKMRPAIEDWMKKELVAAAYDDILFETKIKPIGYPQVTRAEVHQNEFFCDMTLLKKPEFELKQYKDFEIPRPHQSVSSTDKAHQTLEELRRVHGSPVPYAEQDFVQLGDKVTMDVTIGEDFQEGLLYQVGSNLMAGFDDEMLGMNAGEERTFKLKAPLLAIDEPDSLRGGSEFVHCKVKLHMGMRQNPAPLDDELGKAAGCKSLEHLVSTIESYFANEANVMEKHQVTQQLIGRIIDQYEFEVPTWLASMELQNLIKNAGDKFTEADRDSFALQAKKNIRWSLILDSIRAEEPECVFSDEELVNMIKNRYLSSQSSDVEAEPDVSKQNALVEKTNKLIEKASKDGTLIGMIANLKNEITIQWLLDHNKVVD